MSTPILKLRELLHSDDSGEWGDSPSGINDLLILRAGNIADETWLDLSDVVHRTISEPKRTKLLLREGDILLERSGGTDTRPVGRVAFVDRDMEAGFSNFLHRLRVNRSIADPSYVRFVLAQWHRSGRAVALQTQTTGIRNLMFSRYLDEPIRLPSLIIQRKFAAILESATASLAHADALIAAKREQKRGLMQQLLTGKVRFPGFTEPWRTVRLADVLSEDRTPGSTGASARKITVKLYGKGVIAKVEKRAGSENTRYFRRRAGQLIYSKLDCLNGAFGIIPEQLEGYESTLDMPAFDICPSANPDWLLAVVSRPSFYTRFKDGADGSRKAQRVDPARFLEELIQLPSRHEQDSIAALLLCAESEIILLTSQRQTMAAQRRGLMERLLSGEIEVPSTDTCAA